MKDEHDFFMIKFFGQDDIVTDKEEVILKRFCFKKLWEKQLK